MSEIQNNSFDDLQKLSEQDLSDIQDISDWKAVEELKNVICNLDNDAVRLALTLDERGEADYNHKEMSELYKDFISDTNEIVKDWMIDSIELARLESINKLINLSTFSVFWIDWEEFHEIADKDIDSIKSIKQLVYSREILDRIWWENNFSISDLKLILWLIENVWTSNIDEKDLGEINQLVTDIFDEWIDRSDIGRLQKLQVMLLVTYNVEQNQKYENFSLDEEKVEWDNIEDIKETKYILNLLADLDNEYWDLMNEIAPTIWNFLDSVAIEVKDWLIDWDWNSLWASLRLVMKQFWDFKESFDKIDFSDPIWSRNEILQFQAKLMWVDKYLFIWNSLNLLRHMLPESLWLFFTWIKEIKNYYIKSTWSETEHWVFVQEMHMYRDEIKSKDYTNESIQKSTYTPKFLKDWDKEVSKKIKEIASIWADSVDKSMINSLSIVNWWSDAILDLSGVLLSTILLPEKTIEKIGNIDSWEIVDWLKNIIPDNIDEKLISELLYLASYIAMYITASSIVPWLIWWTKIVNNLLSKFSSLVWKPIWELNTVINKWLSKITKTNEFQKLSKIVWKSDKINNATKNWINNTINIVKTPFKIANKVESSIKNNTWKFFGKEMEKLDNTTWKVEKIVGEIDKNGWRINYTNDWSNRLQKMVNKNINKAA